MCVLCFRFEAHVFNLLHRTWPRKSVRRQITKSNKRTFSLLSVQRSNKQKQMPSSVLAVSRGNVAIARLKPDLPMNRWLYVCVLLEDFLFLSFPSFHYQTFVTYVLPKKQIYQLLTSYLVASTVETGKHSFSLVLSNFLMLSLTDGNSPECLVDFVSSLNNTLPFFRLDLLDLPSLLIISRSVIDHLLFHHSHRVAFLCLLSSFPCGFIIPSCGYHDSGLYLEFSNQISKCLYYCSPLNHWLSFFKPVPPVPLANYIIVASYSITLFQCTTT